MVPILKKSLFYSKLAVLELCGWIEETMDRIARAAARRNLKDESNRNYIEKNVIAKTSGFGYEQHFRRMLIHVVGLRGVERIERDIDPVILQVLKSTLGSLKKRRNEEAHTHIQGTIRTLDAPSQIILYLDHVYYGLIEINAALKKGGF